MSPAALAFSLAFLNTLSAPVADVSVDGAAGTARTLTPRRLEVGLWGPARFGLARDLELSAHPLVAVRMPNARLKRRWLTWRRWDVATAHEVAWPTPLLEDLRREGALGLYPLESRFPHVLATRHEVLLSSPGDDGRDLTVRAGVRAAIRGGASDFPTLDLPVVHPRTAAWQGRWVAEGGLALDGDAASWLRYRLAIQALYVVPDAAAGDPDGAFAAEQLGMFTWRIGEGFAAHAGWRLVFGDYPFGRQVDMLPSVDAQWAWDL